MPIGFKLFWQLIRTAASRTFAPREIKLYKDINNIYNYKYFYQGETSFGFKLFHVLVTFINQKYEVRINSFEILFRLLKLC